MVKKVKDGAIRAVDRVESALDEVPVIALIVGDVNIRVLFNRMRASVLHVLLWWKTGNKRVSKQKIGRAKNCRRQASNGIVAFVFPLRACLCGDFIFENLTWSHV